MENLLEQLLSFWDIEFVAGLAAALLTIFAAGASSIIKNAMKIEIAGVTLEFKETDDPEYDSRLKEARDALERQESIAKWYNRAAGWLTFGQYIIGGVLASSFIQEALSTNLVGALGVLVLMSSLVHQRYRPDLQASGARRRAFALRVLIRKTEDDIFKLTGKHSDALSIFQIRSAVTSGLTEIEETELADTDPEKAATTAS